MTIQGPEGQGEMLQEPPRAAFHSLRGEFTDCGTSCRYLRGPRITKIMVPSQTELKII